MNAGAETLGAAFRLERVFAAPRPLVFAAFTDPRHLGRWWGPKELKVDRQTMDLRPGGHYHYHLSGPGGLGLWGRFVFREITPPELLVFVSGFSDAEGGATRHPMAPVWPLGTLTTIRFDVEGDGTRTRLLSEPIDASAAEQAAFDAGHASMTRGWGGSLDRLDAWLASGAEV